MLGYLLNTLSRRLDTEEKEWLEKNRLRVKFELGLWQASIMRAASTPVKFGLILFCVTCIVSALAFFVSPRHWVIFYIKDFHITDQIDYFSALWSVQASVVALVYPIVISFVTLLVERSNSARAALHIYLHDSAALLAGISALLLVGAMGIQYIGLPYAEVSSLAVWIALDAFWFLINLGLTIYFLVRTFEFVRSGRRFEIIKRYAVSVAWPQEVRVHLARHFFNHAVLEKLLPGPNYDGDNSSACIQLGTYGMYQGDSVLTHNFEHNSRQLIDIRFNLLSLAVRLWLKEENAIKPVIQSAKPKWSGKGDGAILIFPLTPFETYEEKITLCRIQGGRVPSRLVLNLIRFSFVFGKSRTLREASINDIFQDALSEVISALRANEQSLFEEHLDRLIELYTLLVSASRISDSFGAPSNLTAIIDSNHWFDLAVYDSWNRLFADLFEVASKKLSSGEEYVSHLAHVPGRLFSASKDVSTPKMLKSIIALSPNLLRRIEDSWGRMLEEQGRSLHGPCNPEILKPPFYGAHDRVFRDFVGAWESLKNRLPPKKDSDPIWSQFRVSAEYLECHLSHTLVMMFDCILRGDKNGSEWLADILIKWYDGIRYQLDDHGHYFLRKQHDLSIEILSVRWTDVDRGKYIESFGAPQDPSKAAVFAACLKNLWVDTCCIAIYSLIIWGLKCDCKKSLPTHIVAALISGTPLRPGGSSSRNRPYLSVDELLLAILRQRYANQKYQELLESNVERIADLSRPHMVSGRMYSRSGADDLNSLEDGMLLAILLEIPTQWVPGTKLLSVLLEWANTSNEKVRYFLHTLNRWKVRLQDADFLAHADHYECLRDRLNRDIDFTSAVSSFDGGIDQLINRSSQERTQALIAAPISERKLLKISEWCSQTAFNSATSYCPIPLFGEVSVSQDESLKSYSLVIKGVKRGELTEPPQEDLAVNEDEWFSETMRGYVASSVLGVTLQQLKVETVHADTPESYWAVVKTYISDAIGQGLHPVLLVSNPTEPSWNWDWVYSQNDPSAIEAPPDLVVNKKRDGMSQGYQWSFNDAPVYAAPVRPGGSTLLVLESLGALEFVKPQRGSVVAVKAEASKDNEGLVDLTLAWKMKIVTHPHLAVRVEYGK